MAKEKTRKSKAAPAAAKAKPAKPAAKASKATKVTKVEKVAKGAKKLAAENPVAAEVVAATLVAAAAALRNPAKARALAVEAADDIKKAARTGVESGSALWQLALDVARRSVDALGDDKKGKAKKSGAKKKK